MCCFRGISDACKYLPWCSCIYLVSLFSITGRLDACGAWPLRHADGHVCIFCSFMCTATRACAAARAAGQRADRGNRGRAVEPRARLARQDLRSVQVRIHAGVA